MTAGTLARRTRRFGRDVDRLPVGRGVDHVYNPLVYARAVHEAYLEHYGAGRKRVIYLGMNPGPFGMVQTGVPFGEVAIVRDWLRLAGPVEMPATTYAPRPIEGFACRRSEVSGRRLWGFFKDQFGTPEAFFREHLVMNYCPLAFFIGARNVTPDKLPADERARLITTCDAYLRDVAALLEPEWVVGIGTFAAARATAALAGADVRIGQILHPSPASPAANADWAGVVAGQLRRLGLR